MTTAPTAAALDAAYDAFKAKRIDRADAISRIRAVTDVTVAGAEEMLDHPQLPSARYRVSS